MSAPSASYHVAQLLEKMTNSDKDYRYMAANDLMSELQKDSIKLDEDSERKIVKMLLKLLEDKNGEVQNLAVKCLGLLVNKVKELQVETIIDQLCSNMMTSDNKEQLRDVSSIGLKTVISELPPSATPLASNIFKRITPKLTNALPKADVPVQLEILDILADMLLRFGGVLVVYHSTIQEALLPQLESPRLAVRKRAIGALSHLVATCNPTLFRKIMDILSEELRKNANPSTTRTYVSCVGAICRSAGTRFGEYLDDQIMPLLVKYSREYDDDELREYCIQAFESFVLKCPQEIKSWLPQILGLCSEFLCYDPNYHYDDGDGADEDMNGKMDDDFSADESDDQEYSDDEDMSWKVRRSSAKCLEAILFTRRELLVELYQTVSPLLISRFKEREENVKADIFHAYIALLKHTKMALPSGAARDEGDGEPMELCGGLGAAFLSQVPLVVKAVARQLREKSVKTRQVCFALLSQILRVMPGSLGDHMSLLSHGIHYSLQDKNSNSNMKIDALSFLQDALATHDPRVFTPLIHKLVPIVVACVEDSFYKVVAETLLVIQQLTKVIAGEASGLKDEALLRDIYGAVLSKLKATDIDQEVKEKAITCMGDIVAYSGDVIRDQMAVCLPLLLERLKNEITRLTTVRALTVIANSSICVDLNLILPEAMPELASFLRKNQRALRVSDLTLLLALSKNYTGQLSAEMVYKVLIELPQLVNDADLQLAQMSLTLMTEILQFQPEVVGGTVEKVLSCVYALIQSPLLQGPSLAAVQEFFKAILKTGFPGTTFSDIQTNLLALVHDHGPLHKTAYKNVAKSLGSICSEAPGEARALVEQLVVQLKDSRSPEQINYFVLLSLGEIGRLAPRVLEGTDTEQVVLHAFSSSKEEIQKAASYALGAIAAGNLEKFLPFILNEINTQPKRQYLLLISLKEVISSESTDAKAAEIIRPYIQNIWTVLSQHFESNEEGTRNVVAECLGKLCLLDPENLLPKLGSSLSSRSPLARATTVTAFKFTIMDQPQKIDSMLKACIGEFLQTLRDEDLNVRRVALVTLNSAAHNKPSLIRDLLPQVLPLLYNETKVRKELIREVEMGPFKHTVDDGLDLRKAAFECMYTLLESCLERLDIFEFLERIEDGLKDHYDIKMLTYLMVTRLATLCPTQVLQRPEKLIDPLKQACTAKVKTNAVKQEFEKQEELKRAAVRAFVALQKIPDANKTPQLADFFGIIKSTPELNMIYESVKKDPGQKTSFEDEDSMDTS